MTGDFVALIPARLASTRLPDKPLADIAGKPMIVRVAEQAQRSGARLVAVATDSASIADVVTAAGFCAVLTRADHLSGTDRLAEAAGKLGLSSETIVVNVQGDEPLLPPELIRQVAAALGGAGDCAIATAAHPIHLESDYLSPNVVKVVTDRQGRALYFSRSAIPHDREGLGRRATAPVSASGTAMVGTAVTGAAGGAATGLLARHGLPLRHIGLYAYRAGFLAEYPGLAPSPAEQIESLEQLRALHHGYRILVCITESSPPPGVDTPADLDRVRQVFGGPV